MADYLRVPHIVLKMQQVLKNSNAYLCLQFIWYKTGGWNKGRDTIAYSQFANDKVHGIGASTKTIRRCVELLIEKRLIIATPSFNNMYEYSLNLDQIRSLATSEGVTICHTHNVERVDKMSASEDILSASMDNLSVKGGQIDHHNRYITLNTNTLNTNTKDKTDSSASETETDVESTDAKSDTENTKPPAKKKPAKKLMTEFSDDFTATEKQIEKCNEYGINVAELIEEMADNKRSNSISHACWTSAFNTWIRNHIKFNRLKPVTHTATSHQTAKTSYRKTPDPLAVNAKWNVQTQMTEEEKRQWLSGDVDSDIPSAFLSDNNRNYG